MLFCDYQTVQVKRLSSVQIWLGINLMFNFRKGQFAIVRRGGGCEFVTKALNVQAAGYYGIIILDNVNRNNLGNSSRIRTKTKFTKLIFSDKTAPVANFVRIPVLFLPNENAANFVDMMSNQVLSYTSLVLKRKNST